MGNSTGEAKALWMLEKVAEGYNDFYFADDAIKNVNAVKDVLRQVDVKSDVQQARKLYSTKLSKDFNKIIEETTGFKAGYTVGDTKAELLGRGKWTESLVLPGHQDFMGLMYSFMTKGKKG